MTNLSKLMKALTVLIIIAAMAVDMKSGSVIQAAEGLAVWPNLKYTLPAN